MAYNKALPTDSCYSVSYTRNLVEFDSSGNVNRTISAKEIINMQYNFNYTQSGTTYPVILDSNKNMYVSLPIASADTYGVVKLMSGLTNQVTPNSVTKVNNRSYYVVKNSNNALIVNVPWSNSDIVPNPSSSQEGSLLYVSNADTPTLAWGYREFNTVSTSSIGYYSSSYSGSIKTIKNDYVSMYTISVTAYSSSCIIYASTSSSYTSSLSSSNIIAMANATYSGEVISITFIARKNETIYVGGGYISSGYCTQWYRSLT